MTVIPAHLPVTIARGHFVPYKGQRRRSPIHHMRFNLWIWQEDRLQMTLCLSIHAINEEGLKNNPIKLKSPPRRRVQPWKRQASWAMSCSVQQCLVMSNIIQLETNFTTKCAPRVMSGKIAWKTLSCPTWYLLAHVLLPTQPWSCLQGTKIQICLKSAVCLILHSQLNCFHNTKAAQGQVLVRSVIKSISIKTHLFSAKLLPLLALHPVSNQTTVVSTSWNWTVDWN